MAGVPAPQKSEVTVKVDFANTPQGATVKVDGSGGVKIERIGRLFHAGQHLMPARFDPLSALEGSFRGFPFKIARERGEGGRRGPVHEYPDRDEPFFEDMGRRAKRWELNVYFVGPSADLQADLWDKLLWKGEVGPLILPRLRRERVKAQTWSYDRDAGKGNWVACNVAFVEAGQNQFPAPTTSWPHALLEAALDARTAFADAMGSALSLVGLDGTLSQEAVEGLIGDAMALGEVLTVVAQVAGGQAPASALAQAGLLVTAYTERTGAGARHHRAGDLDLGPSG